MATAIFALLVGSSGAAWAATKYKVLHNFGVEDSDGYAPEAALAFDSHGNLYGTTVAGGSGCGYLGCGVVFRLKRTSNGRWAESVIHHFNRSDGYHPYAPVIVLAKGNLYGTTSGDGSTNNGTIFELTPNSKGKWTESTLHTFKSSRDGARPFGGVLLDDTGHLYGVTSSGGANRNGIAFGLGKTGFRRGVLHAFSGGEDGGVPYDTLTRGQDGNLYGTTYLGGSNGAGTVFSLTSTSEGNWKETVLYAFQGTAYGRGSDGANPYAGVTLDSAGNLCGTTFYGGPNGAGTVFKLTHNADGSWTESVLYAFKGGARDGSNPYGGVTFDQSGSLFGTTVNGGSRGHGSVYKLVQTARGVWTETILHEFSGGLDGGWPVAGLAIDSAGNLFGTALVGGRGGFEHDGVLFEIIQ